MYIAVCDVCGAENENGKMVRIYLTAGETSLTQEVDVCCSCQKKFEEEAMEQSPIFLEWVSTVVGEKKKRKKAPAQKQDT